MARKMKVALPPVRRAAATRDVRAFVAQALGPIDWAQWWTWDDYRILTNVQVFGLGLAAYAGNPPTILALSAGMDAVFQWVMNNAPTAPAGIPAGQIGYAGDSKAEQASEAATEVARLMYEDDVIASALSGLSSKWSAARTMAIAKLGV